jgi:hypothetical protein
MPIRPTNRALDEHFGIKSKKGNAFTRITTRCGAFGLLPSLTDVPVEPFGFNNFCSEMTEECQMFCHGNAAMGSLLYY